MLANFLNPKKEGEEDKVKQEDKGIEDGNEKETNQTRKGRKRREEKDGELQEWSIEDKSGQIIELINRMVACMKRQ
jgi:hypothetical protein